MGPWRYVSSALSSFRRSKITFLLVSWISPPMMNSSRRQYTLLNPNTRSSSHTLPKKWSKICREREGGGEGELADGDAVYDAFFGNGEDIDAVGRGTDEIEATAHFVNDDIGRGSAEAVDCAKRRSGGLGEYRSARNQEEGERTEEDRLQEHKRIR